MTDFTDANLTKVNLLGAEISTTNLAGANLLEAIMPDGTVGY